MIRVAFTLIGGANWTGGRHYLLNLVRTLGLHQNDRIKPVLFMNFDCSEAEVAPFAALPGIECVRAPHLDTGQRGLSLLQGLIWGIDVPARKLFEAHRIDLVFESARFFGWRLDIPAIAWIPDFQHLALPGMFTPLGRWKREIGFRAQVWSRRVIMLSSEDARRTAEAHFPMTRGLTRTVHFAVAPGTPMTLSDARAIADEYGLPDRFFFMPNQFWKHKNHELVAQALAILRQRGVPVTVAASGRQEDPRDPGYFPYLQERVRQLGVGDAMVFLGLIPHAHIPALLRAGSALLNPSLFEGWSTTVEEARSLGTPMILSDLDVHREQMGGNATYFKRQSPESLADAIENFQPSGLVEREQMAEAARREANQRVRRFGEDFADLAESCVQSGLPQ